MTPLDTLLAELEEVAKRATPGKRWVGHVSEQHEDAADIDSENGAICDNVYGAFNRSFLCAATPEVIQKLIAIIREMKSALEFYDPPAGSFQCFTGETPPERGAFGEFVNPDVSRAKQALARVDEIVGE